jgi:integrase
VIVVVYALAQPPNTQRHYQTAIQRLNAYIGDTVVSVSDYSMLQELFNEQLTPRYAPYTIHTTYSVLFHALEFAVEPCSYISSNPAAKISLPKGKAVSPSIALSFSELISILRLALNHRYGAIILFAALTGTRVGESVAVCEKDVDLERDTIIIRRQLNQRTGEGLVEGPVKNDNARDLPRTPRLAQFLDRHIAERRTAFRHLGIKEESGGWFFLNTQGRRVSPRLAEEAFDEIVEQANLSEKYPAVERLSRQKITGDEQSNYKRKTCAVSFHDLRSTLLTQLGDLDVDETTRARIAGHGPKNVTQRYDRSTLERMRAALCTFEDLVFNELASGQMPEGQD